MPKGLSSIKKFLAALLAKVPDFRFRNIRIWIQTPDQAFGEYDVEALVPSTGKTYRQTYAGRLVAEKEKSNSCEKRSIPRLRHWHSARIESFWAKSKDKERYTMSNKLEAKTAVITGGTSGIGLATAKRFVAEGAYVFITGRRQKELDQAVTKVGRNVTGIQGDIANLADLDRLYAQVKTEKGHIDVLVANAGGGSFAPLSVITEEHFDKTFDGNVKGTLFTVQKALPLIRDGGSIILTASSAASNGTEAFSVYAASKAAIRSFARGWTADLRARKIRVNAISPGVVPTEGYNTSLGMTAAQVDQFAQQMSAGIPLGRVGTPDEIAKAMVFLASDDSSYISGIELAVDGGMNQV